ncbi:MAG: alpha/beta hydrolase [Clostridia bacterium]|nr:alpha/beta hydrolase [Clostridia bacterium]
MNYELKTAKTAGFEMDYLKFGSGKRTMVILPGIALSSVLQTAPAIAEAYSGFADEFTVYLFENRKNIRKGYTVEDMAEDAAAAMKDAGIEKACIFGASHGGMVAQSIAVLHPEIVEKLFIASSLSRPNEVFTGNLEEMDRLIKAGTLEEMNHFFFEHVYSEEYIEKYKDVFDFLAKMGTEEEVEKFLLLIDSCRNFDISDRISSIKCPAFAVGSKKDKMLTGEATAETAELLGCGYYLYEGFGHAVYDEAPDYKDRIMVFFGRS